jgi:hypothetical protein
MRIPVTFTESVLFQEHAPILPPASDVMPLNGPAFQGAYPNPIKAVDPLSATTHVYPDCYAGFGKWEIQSVIVTNANIVPIEWSLMKMPAGAYKFTDHLFYRYSANPPGGNPQDITLKFEPRNHTIFYAQPLHPIATWISPRLQILMAPGESLWASGNPGYDVSVFSGPLTNIRITGEVIV